MKPALTRMLTTRGERTDSKCLCTCRVNGAHRRLKPIISCSPGADLAAGREYERQIFHAQTQGLLNIHMLAGLHGLADIRGMRVVPRGDQHGVGVLTEQLGNLRRAKVKAELFGDPAAVRPL